MAENNLTLAYLPFASQSQEDSNGKPLVNGHIEVYLAGSTTKYITYNDFDGTHNEANIPLNSLGRATVLASVDLAYDIYVYNKNNVLIYSRENVTCGTESGYLPGTIVVRVDGTENEILSTASSDISGNLIYTESLDPHFMNRIEDLETQVSANTANILTNAEDIIDIYTNIETITSDISGMQTHIEVIENNITLINDTLDTLQTDVDTLQTDVDIVESDVAALKLSDQYTTFKATSAAGSGGYTFKIATALKTKAPLTSTTILEYDLTNNYLGKINSALGMRGHVVYQQIMQMDDQYSSVDYMHYTHLYEFSDRWELWGHTAAGWAGDISVRPVKNISIAITVHVNPWVFVGKAVSASLPTVYTEHNWVDYTMPVNNSKKTSVWAEGVGTSDHKVMIDANDQNAKYLNDKILTGGILSKAIEAAGEVGDWYEVLRLTATLYTDGTTCSGAGTSSSPLVATGDHKSICSIGDVPGYLENKLVGSTWIDASNIPLSSDEKNIMFALKNPDFFVKGNTIYGGTVVGVIGDLNEQSHNGYFTGYYNTLNAPPVQAGNPSWFVHHMNSNTGTAYAVQIAYAYTSTIICYERTKVAGVWQAWTLRSPGGSSTSEVAHIATGDSLGAKDIIQLQAGSSTQWSAHGAMCSTIGAITPGILSKMGFIATQVVTGNFIIAAYKVETNLAHSLICATGVNALPASAGWINTPVLNHVKAIAANDRVYLVVLTNSNGVAMAGASCTAFNIQPYVAGIKTNLGILTEAPATLTFDSETTSRPFIYMVK